MTRPLLVGVTGGIGSGKSVVCRLFEILGVPVYHADDRGKWLLENDDELKKGVIKTFGKESYVEDKLNRGHLAKSFHDESTLEKLNKLVHPAVARDFSEWVLGLPGEILIKEAALLFETGSYRQLDKTILVTAPESIRIDRVLKRDKFRSREEVLQIIDKQWGEDRKKELADYVIKNDGRTMIIPQVMELFDKIRS